MWANCKIGKSCSLEWLRGLKAKLPVMAAWLSGNGIAHINKVTLRRAGLVLGWVTVREFESRTRVRTVLVFNQSPRLTQPGHAVVGRRNEAQWEEKASSA